jgi:hypothetical protein
MPKPKQRGKRRIPGSYHNQMNDLYLKVQLIISIKWGSIQKYIIVHIKDLVSISDHA